VFISTNSLAGAEWAKTWMKWNKEEVSIAALDFEGYDGIDWDLEGNDAPSSPWNTFSPECMRLVGEMSQGLKAHGFLVSLVPPQSYLDVTSPLYDRSLLHSYSGFHPDFAYHGANVYALWLSKYGMTGKRQTFDFVDVQLYEGFSRAGEAIVAHGMDPATYIVEWARALQKGWWVDFAHDAASEWNSTMVRVPANQLVVGFSHGAQKLPHEKSIFIPPSDVAKAWAILKPHERPRGVMFWNMENDGGSCWYPNGTHKNVSFAQEFNGFLHTRVAAASE